MSGPIWSDYIADFMALTEGVPSPDIYRRWAAISQVGAALERRVWAQVGAKPPTFANLYMMLVGPPGTGKFIIEDARGLMAETMEPGTKQPAFRVAPDSMTKASLMDTLAKAKQTRPVPKGSPYTYHSLYCPAEEFGVLLPEYDQTYIHNLNGLFNNKALHEESRRTGSVRELRIENPQLNILGGAAPTYLAMTFPEEAWTTGLARRLLLIYSPEPPQQELFFEPTQQPGARQRVLIKLAAMSQLYGCCAWGAGAAEHLASWHRKGGPPTPEHSKLIHYNRSRTLQAIKLSIISAVSRTGKLVIELVDVQRAIEWLLEIERVMPDIFRAMVGRSDAQVLEELHFYLLSAWARNAKKPLQGSAIEQFLMTRVPSDKIERLRLVAERSDMIVRVGGSQDLWLPKPKQDHRGVE